jgi:hypothetical protein
MITDLPPELDTLRLSFNADFSEAVANGLRDEESIALMAAIVEMMVARLPPDLRLIAIEFLIDLLGEMP